MVWLHKQLMADPLLLLTVLFLLSAPVLPSPSPSRVAIIGAGIGGAFAAHSLALLSPEHHIDIDVFEAAPVVGGRAHSFEFQGTTLELGASIIWNNNLHLSRAAQKLGLAIKQLQDSPEEVPGFAVFNGKRFVLNQTGTASSMAKMALRYGLSPLLYSRHVLKVWEDSFQQIYSMQDEQRRSFQDPEEMLQALGLLNLTQQSCAQHMQDFFRPIWWTWGSRAFANDLAGAINRCNYNQGNDQLNALAGLISFLPAAAPDLWSVEGGNCRLAQALLDASNCTLHLGRAVTHISQGPEGTFLLSTSKTAGDGGNDASVSGIHGPYDSIIIAAPLESANITFVPYSGSAPAAHGAGATGSMPQHEPSLAANDRLEGAQQGQALVGGERPGAEACRWLRCSEGAGRAAGAPAGSAEHVLSAEVIGGDGLEAGADGVQSRRLQRTYQQTVTTYVSGELQAAYFGVQSLPSHRVFASDDALLPFSSIGPKLVGGQRIYKVFSAEPLGPSNSSGGLLAQLFGPDVQVLASRVWAAYPRFSPPERFVPFRLGPGLCYVNALENAASAMELAAIGGRNCALEAWRQLQRRQCRPEGQACGGGAAAAAEPGPQEQAAQ